MTNEERACRWIEDRDLGRATVESDVMSLAMQFDKVREEAAERGRLRDALRSVDNHLRAIIVYAKAGSELETTALDARKVIVTALTGA